MEGTEANRQMLKEAVKDGRVRKVLVKYDISVTSSLTEADLIDQLMEGFQLLRPYYDSCHDTMIYCSNSVIEEGKNARIIND